jgi:hypothetical protein
VSLAALGCGAVPDEGGSANAVGPPEAVGTVGQEVKTCRRGIEIIKGQWQAGESSKVIASTSTHICALHRVQGSFRDGLENVFVRPLGNDWVLGGVSWQPDVNAVAWCAERACFTRPFGDSISGTVSADAARVEELCSFTHSNPTTLGDSATMISSFTGRFDGRGEHVFVEQDMWGDETSYISAEACSSGIAVGAHSYFAGRPRQPTKFVQLNGAKEFFVDASTGPLTWWLVRADQAYCYLSDISGKFVSTFDRIDLAPVSTGGVMYWRLDVTSTAGSGGQSPRAGARCMYYSQ